MATKTPVSALEEYCSKYKNERPEYKFIKNDDDSFTCMVKFLDTETSGNARSKRDAKHLAATNIMRTLNDLGAKIENELPEFRYMKSLTGGLSSPGKTPVSKLQEFCVKFKKGSPEYSCINISLNDGFLCTVKVLHMKTHGVAPSKREAKHLAALNMMEQLKNLPGLEYKELLHPKCDMPEMLPVPILELGSQFSMAKRPVICNDVPKMAYTEKSFDNDIPILELDMELISTSRKMDDVKSEQQRVFNIYKEIKDSGPMDCNNVSLSDRHNYFKSFPYSLKAAALKILESANDSHYFSDMDRALSVLKALKLTPKITKVPSTCVQQLLQIEPICDYDCVFLGFECDIYGRVLQYFREMLI